MSFFFLFFCFGGGGGGGRVQTKLANVVVYQCVAIVNKFMNMDLFVYVYLWCLFVYLFIRQSYWVECPSRHC